ncbi:CCA tRNA nucleotidyltransferase [Domibacillus epiphyticus]|uniref:CCA-adding enzyme n=1 Tax=Domibacillus epiphyticus TaxID=1714355 RepID=A0A1V2A4V8_9BACI|nr:CCA tRNA nucleotidyltransferase [Domibacillus epiphyticus]OMP65844.1 CCA tRNA nucleotidyltransferase [Domibacillus epiphyticus]
MIDHPFFKEALPIIQALEESGHEAYFVGGAVRDLLLHRPIHDIDIATSALPNEVKTIFMHTIDVGIEHGTILVLRDGCGFEVTTFRTESEYSDFRRPDEVKFVRSLHDDLKRRDFTMNAIAMTAEGKLIDPFNGQPDLTKGIIRTVGDASERFSEDALRMMRAARFMSQLSFELDPKTCKALVDHAPLLSHIAVERKLNEMDKLLSAPDKAAGLSIIAQTGLYAFLPGLAGQKKTIERIAALQLQPLSVNQMWILIVYEAAAGDITNFLRGWRMSSRRVKRIEKGVRTLNRVLTEGWTDLLLYEMQLEAAVDCAEAMAVLDGRPSFSKDIISRWHALPIKSRSDLNATGSDLMEWTGKPRGAWIKECLELVEKAIMNREINNTKEQIKEFLLSCSRL